MPKPPVHKTYIKKCKSREHNEEFPVQSPHQNKELIQYPEHHGELPLHPTKQNEESPVQSPEHHGELQVQYPDLVTNDEICVVITLKEFKGHVDSVGDIYPTCTLNLINLALLNHYPKFN